MYKISLLMLAIAIWLIPLGGCAQLPAAPGDPVPQPYAPYTAEQLDNLLAPIALYPDPLLAQVLIAATFPDQIDEAARWVRSYGDNGIDDQSWDTSVRAVAHYASVLYRLDDDLNWTIAVGQAYAFQSTDVMVSIQRLRAMARAQGNLVTTPQQEVIVDAGFIAIWPASATYIYVPVYDPSIVFFRTVYFDGSFTAFSFGTALTIGVWLNLDCDWPRHRVYYTGWQGKGWISRSRPHVHINRRYVDSGFSTIVINRRIGQRSVNYEDLMRYRGVHPKSKFDNRARGSRARVRPETRVPNKIIDRNIPPNNALAPFRGRQAPPTQPQPAPATRGRGQSMAPTPARPATPLPRPAIRPKEQSPPAARPPNAFGRGDARFDSNAASRRGRQSREEMRRPPVPRPSPQIPRRQPAVKLPPADQYRHPGTQPMAPGRNRQPTAKPAPHNGQPKPERRQQ